jgi:hypothetical protein
MYHNYKMYIIFCFGSTLFLPLCAQFKQEQNGIEIMLVDYGSNPQAIAVHMDSYSGLELMEKGLHPIRFMINNKTDKPIVFGPNSLCVTSPTQDRIYDALRKRFSTKAIVFTCFGLLLDWRIAFIASGLYYWLSIYQPNQRIEKAIKKLILNNQQMVIHPNQRMDTIILFDSASYTRIFTLRILDFGQNPVATFQVVL